MGLTAGQRTDHHISQILVPSGYHTVLDFNRTFMLPVEYAYSEIQNPEVLHKAQSRHLGVNRSSNAGRVTTGTYAYQTPMAPVLEARSVHPDRKERSTQVTPLAAPMRATFPCTFRRDRSRKPRNQDPR